ncbi:MAG: diguanylate cyclase [Armatimonadetes bacterium]|nr:diguanylate cyclase [Armatimonadota bacterium]
MKNYSLRPATARSRVLIVDEAHENRLLVGQWVRCAGHEVVLADGGQRALKLLSDENFDLILLDFRMQRMDGFDVLRRIRINPALTQIPVVVSGVDELEVIIRCIEGGAEDYLTWPVAPPLLLARVHACLEKKRLRDGERRYLQELLDLKRDLARRNEELTVANALLEETARTDPVTGIPNRRSAMKSLDHLWALANRTEQSLACLMVDIDHFKAVNDNYGHQAGDRVLRETVAAMKKGMRASDVLGRWGGDEFLILCPATEAASARACAGRLVRLVGRQARARARLPVTVSVGVSQKLDRMTHPEQLIQAADEALYEAKRAGRDQVSAAG